MFTADNLREYNERGYTVVKAFFPPQLADAMLAKQNQWISQEWDLGALQAQSQPFSTTDQATRSSDEYFLTSGDRIVPLFEPGTDLQVNKIGHALHELEPVFRQATYSPEVRQVLRQLGYKAPACVQSMLILKSGGKGGGGGEVTAHQDGTFLVTDPLSVCGMWVALQPATVSNGCMYFVPGSHRTQRPLQRLFLRSGTSSGGTVFEPPGELAYADDVLASAVPCEAARGDLVVFHGAVVHFSRPNLMAAAPRPAYTMHFCETEAVKWHDRNWLVSRFHASPPLYTSVRVATRALLLPVVDLSPAANAEDAARAWDLAMSSVGACYLVGHGVRGAGRLRRALQAFFAQPLERKLLAQSPNNNGEYGSGTGYNRVGNESVSGGGQVDHVESVYFRGEDRGRQLDAGGGAVLRELASAEAAYRQEVDSKVFRPALKLAGSALGVGDALLDLHYPPSSSQRPYTTLKVSHYPPLLHDSSNRTVLYGAHTDWEGFVFLLPDEHDDERNGLQVWIEEEEEEGGGGRWEAVPPLHRPDGEEAIICNCGDFVPAWTRNRWKSPVHRVVAHDRSSRHRYSIPYFTGPHAETEIVPLVPDWFGRDNGGGGGEGQKHKPVRAGEWLAHRIKAAAVVTDTDTPSSRL